MSASGSGKVNALANPSSAAPASAAPQFATTHWSVVLARLRQDFENAGELARFEVLKPFLVAEKQLLSGAQVAARLGISETAVYSAVHRLRQRYGELLREEIAHPMATPEEIEEELRYLIRVLSG